MKRTICLFLILTCAAVTVSAQNMVGPNRPETILNTSKGFISINQLHFGIGLGLTEAPYSRSFFGFTTINGYQINENFVIAGGTGLSFYNGGMLVPLFLDFRYRFNINPITPYFFADGGVLLDFSGNGSTKIFINPGVGARYSLSRKVAINLDMGLLVQSGGANRDTFITFRPGVTYKF
jgi:hypothetical protein